MELEQAVVEAIKQKLIDTFKKVHIKTSLEGREIVIRISIPDEIMQTKLSPQISVQNSDLDEEALAAEKELLG